MKPAGDVAYSLHIALRKIYFNLDAVRVLRMYGAATVQEWVNCRHQLLNKDVKKVFTKAFMKKAGLDL